MGHRLRRCTSPSGAIRARARPRLRNSASRLYRASAGRSWLRSRMARAEMLTLRPGASFGPRAEKMNFVLFSSAWRIFRSAGWANFRNFSEFLAADANFGRPVEWAKCATMLHFCSICRLRNRGRRPGIRRVTRARMRSGSGGISGELGNTEAGAEIVEEGEPLFLAGLDQTEAGVTGVAAGL